MQILFDLITKNNYSALFTLKSEFLEMIAMDFFFFFELTQPKVTITLLVIKMEYCFSPQFHGIFLAVGDIRMSRVFTTTMRSRPVSS